MKISAKNLFKGIADAAATKAFKKLPIDTQISTMAANVTEKIQKKYEASKALVEAKLKIERLAKENPDNKALKNALSKMNDRIDLMKVEIDRLADAQKMLEAKKAEIKAQMAINEAIRPLNDNILGGGDVNIDNIFSDLEDLLHDQEDEVNAMIEVQSWVGAFNKDEDGKDEAKKTKAASKSKTGSKSRSKPKAKESVKTTETTEAVETK